MKSPIAIIAPYHDLKQVVQATVNELGDDITVYEGNLEEGVDSARKAVTNGAEVIISRGGTAMLIAKSLDVPVVEIQVSPYDILRCLYQLRDQPGLVGITGFSNMVYGSESFGNLFGIRLRQIIIESKEDAQEKISNAAREGINLVIGDAVSVAQAKKLGLRGMLITSGKEAVAKAIDEAKKLAVVRIRERERSELLRIVVDNSHDGIIAIDQNGRTTLFNPAAEEIFGIKAIKALGTPIKEISPTTELLRVLKEGSTEYGALQKVNDKVIVTHRFAVKVNERAVAAVSIFNDVTALQKLEQVVRQKLHAKGLIAKTTLEDIIGESPAIIHLKERTRKFAAVDAAVLIYGESGTGKEMLAQSIHNLSTRPNGPFVAINCAALPEGLLESELFGHEEGSFTGARKGGKQGLFELAHGGTILLDEIGEMPLKLQAQLLRVLQERQILRVGGDRIIPIDVRIIAATNRNLQTEISNGQFREDLYYRLAVLKLTVPSLRERSADIPMLISFFLHKHGHLNRSVRSISEQALQQFQKYDWPGNVRELEHVMQRLLILAGSKTISLEAATDMLKELQSERKVTPSLSDCSTEKLADIEAQTIANILAEENFNKTKTAKRLGINRSTLFRKLRGVANSNIIE